MHTLLNEYTWIRAAKTDPIAVALYSRHYSSSSRNQRNWLTSGITGPGESVTLLTPDGSALFVWNLQIRDDGQEGVNCAVFRNESSIQSSRLILDAEEYALGIWPHTERFFTFVDERKVKSKNPGYCFKVAGWQTCGRTKVKDLVILEKMVTTAAAMNNDQSQKGGSFR